MTGFQDSNTAKYLKSIYSVSTPAECAAIYDGWSESYDVDVAYGNVEYVAPNACALRAKTAGGNITGDVLDAGCGTGLVGLALAHHGAKNIDGIDLSTGMLYVARKTGVYRDLLTADMCKRIDMPDESYDVITCCGTFTPGHVGVDPAVRELVRLTKKGGVIVATIIDVYFESGGFQAEIERLASDGLLTIVDTTKEAYRRGSNTLAHMVVLRRSDLSYNH